MRLESNNIFIISNFLNHIHGIIQNSKVGSRLYEYYKILYVNVYILHIYYIQYYTVIYVILFPEQIPRDLQFSTLSSFHTQWLWATCILTTNSKCCIYYIFFYSYAFSFPFCSNDLPIVIHKLYYFYHYKLIVFSSI